MGAGYLEAQGGWQRGQGLYLRGEVGHNFTPNLGGFAYAQGDSHGRGEAGAGLRLTW